MAVDSKEVHMMEVPEEKDTDDSRIREKVNKRVSNMESQKSPLIAKAKYYDQHPDEDEEYQNNHGGKSFMDRISSLKRVTRGGNVYYKYNGESDVTKEVRARDGESKVTKGIMDKYNKQFAPQEKPQKAVSKAETVSTPETEEATINDQKVRIPKATKRQKQMFISNRGNEYYAWRRQQQEAYNRARKNAK